MHRVLSFRGLARSAISAGTSGSFLVPPSTTGEPPSGVTRTNVFNELFAPPFACNRPCTSKTLSGHSKGETGGEAEFEIQGWRFALDCAAQALAGGLLIEKAIDLSGLGGIHVRLSILGPAWATRKPLLQWPTTPSTASFLLEGLASELAALQSGQGGGTASSQT